jgi:RHS repeat-associated protein
MMRCIVRESDSETGLYYYRARYYDPGTGRFLSEDLVRVFESAAQFEVGEMPEGAKA